MYCIGQNFIKLEWSNRIYTRQAYKVTLGSIRSVIVAVEIQSEFAFVALVSGMQWEYAILLFVACPPLQYFYTLSHKRYDFRKMLLNVKCMV